jgi:hypothetical protein
LQQRRHPNPRLLRQIVSGFVYGRSPLRFQSLLVKEFDVDPMAGSSL